MRLWFALLLALCACHPTPTAPPPGEVPPLPPASGTAVGYLIDSAGELELRDDQLHELQKIDDGLAAQNGQIDAQLRQIEKPMPEQELSPQEQKAGVPPPRYNNAPGASTITTNDSVKLRKMRDQNDHQALKKAFAILDADQVEKAERILTARGVDVPDEAKPQPASGSGAAMPLPGAEAKAP